MPYFAGFIDLSSGKNQSANNLSTDGIAGVIIGNESGYTVVAKAVGTSVSKSIYPGTVDFVETPPGFSGAIDFIVTAKLANISQWPSAFLQLDIVGVNEPFNRNPYPMALPRQTTIGGSVQTVGGIASQVVQLGSTGAQNLVQGSVSPDAGLSVSILTDGNVIFGDTANHGSLTVVGNIKTTLGNVTSDLGYYNLDNGGVARLFALIASSNNDNVIATNVNNKILHIAKNDLSGDIATFADTLISTFLGQISANAAAQASSAGSVSGTITLYTAVWGTGLKIGIVALNNYNSASTPTLSFPSNLNFAWWFSGNLGASMTWAFQTSVGGAVTARHVLTIGAAGAAGTDEGVTSIHGLNIGHVTGPAGQLSIGSTGAVAFNSTIAFIGQ